MDNAALQQYIEQQQTRYIEELKEFLRISSISTSPQHANDVYQCAEWLAHAAKAVGLENVQIFPTEGHPVVYGDYIHAGDNAPTVLFYGHYDVQPTDPLNLWTNPPFEPTVRDGKIYARGAVDDKGQVFMQLKALEIHTKVIRELPVNVKVLIEGEEEIGSVHLEKFLREKLHMLAADTVLISDTAMFADEVPSICYGLRGLCYMEIEVTGPNRDLHSGVFGGAVANPANALAKILAALTDSYGRITIPGFYDDVIPLTDEEREQYRSLPHNEEEYCRELEIPATDGEFGYSTLEKTSARPSLDVNGLWGGYTGEGAKTVLPSKAYAKVSMRLVPNQNPQDIAHKFEKYVVQIAPPTVRVRVRALHGGRPVITPTRSKGIQAAMRAMEQAFGKKPFLTREGGSIPIVLLFQDILNAPVVLMGVGLNTENPHSPDEHFTLKNLYRGILASALFYKELASIWHSDKY
ncbi:MAG: dipeptidase [Bacteroidota bacterium]|nr:dipeptidase [Candidatus Kapabacteria bacterium]MDW8218959.1 dipeptidase [Bacteroidota bacterium]